MRKLSKWSWPLGCVGSLCHECFFLGGGLNLSWAAPTHCLVPGRRAYLVKTLTWTKRRAFLKTIFNIFFPEIKQREPLQSCLWCRIERQVFLNPISMSMYCQGYLLNEARMQNKTLYQSVPSRKLCYSEHFSEQIRRGEKIFAQALFTHMYKINNGKLRQPFQYLQPENIQSGSILVISTFYDLNSHKSASSPFNCVCHQGQMINRTWRDVNF